jgi:GTP-binding protein Era
MNPEPLTGPAGFRCGYITLLGRPNAGKSTLLNSLLDQKISITSRKPQTTRWQLLGIKSGSNYQAIYVDTPGIQSDYDSLVHRHMTREAVGSLEFVDVVIFMIEAMRWSDADERVLQLVKSTGLPTILAINKIDKVRNRAELLPFIQKVAAITDNAFEVIPISAKTGDNIGELEKTVLSMLPEGPPAYEEDQITNRNQRFFAAEFIREKLIQRLGDELPYRVAVTIELFVEEDDLITIKGVIWVESNSQKNIIIGKNGEVMKSVGESARKDMEQLFQKKVYLRNWVKVKKNWTMSEESLQQLGYHNDPV